MADPVEARTCPKNSRALVCSQMFSRFSSFQAGNTSRNRPGVPRSPYQPMPKPSALSALFALWASRLCSTSEFSGLTIRRSRKTGGPE